MCTVSLGAKEDDHWAHAAETYHQFMRGKVTANQTQAQADQQISPSPALKAMCRSLDRITDGLLRKYDHTSAAADTYLNLHYSCPNNIKAFPWAAESSLAQLFF